MPLLQTGAININGSDKANELPKYDLSWCLLSRCSGFARRMLWLLFLMLTSVSFKTPVYADTVYVGVASNFIAPMKHLSREFKRLSGHDLKVSYASSGKLFAQIRYGAPFHLFLSADQQKPAALIEAELADQASLTTYALGALVLWSSEQDLLLNRHYLISDNYSRLSLANPKLAPYGFAAMETLKTLDLDQQLKARLITGENIAQAYQFVATGNAQIGFVARSQIYAEEQLKSGSSWIIPESYYQPIRQDMVLTKKGSAFGPAVELHRFIQSKAGRAIIRSYGYHLAEK